MIFVDTNYFVRYFIKDTPSQFKTANKLLIDAAKGKKSLFTSTIVIFEIYWVFGSFYKLSKKEITKILKKVLIMNFIKIDERDVIEKSVNLYQNSNLELEDCYNIEYAKSNKMTKFASFDKKVNRYLDK